MRRGAGGGRRGGEGDGTEKAGGGGVGVGGGGAGGGRWVLSQSAVINSGDEFVFSSLVVTASHLESAWQHLPRLFGCFFCSTVPRRTAGGGGGGGGCGEEATSQ